MPGMENLAPERTETRSGLFGSPKPLPVSASTLLDGRQDVVPEPGRELLAGAEVVVAGLGGDGEAGGSRQARVGHLGQAGTLAAQQVLHPAVALGLAAAPGVDVALGGLVGLCARVGHGGVTLLGCGNCRAADGGGTRRRSRDGGELVPQRSGVQRLDVIHHVALADVDRAKRSAKFTRATVSSRDQPLATASGDGRLPLHERGPLRRPGRPSW